MRDLRELVAQELAIPADPRVVAMAEAIAAKHGSASRAVLFYGSCLRECELAGRMLDFYLIVSSYRKAYDKRWLAAANRLIPPNVFYFEQEGLVAKYAVLSQRDFERECGSNAWNVSTAARFAQPSRLVWAADAGASEQVIATVSKAAPTLLDWALPGAGTASPIELWTEAFGLTFNAELRAERLGRSAALVEANPERYEAFGQAALREITLRRGVRPSGELPLSRSPKQGRRWWRKMQRRGKWYSVVRLAKASATFAGGADYIAWKVNRHTNANIELKPWQRRHPLLAGLSLLPRLLRSGAVR